MQTKTITAVHGAREWTGRDGATNYEVEITLDDTQHGTVTAKTPDRWKAGDVVLIKKETVNKYGCHWSLDKPQPNGPQPNQNFMQSGARSGQNGADRTAQIEASWAVHMAVLLAQNAPEGIPPAAMHAAALSMLKLRDAVVQSIKNGELESATYTAPAPAKEPEPW
jgi:hypothetical protein